LLRIVDADSAGEFKATTVSMHGLGEGPVHLIACCGREISPRQRESLTVFVENEALFVGSCRHLPWGLQEWVMVAEIKLRLSNETLRQQLADPAKSLLRRLRKIYKNGRS
jgi:hypothetical protein